MVGGKGGRGKGVTWTGRVKRICGGEGEREREREESGWEERGVEREMGGINTERVKNRRQGCLDMGIEREGEREREGD